MLEDKPDDDDESDQRQHLLVLLTCRPAGIRKQAPSFPNGFSHFPFINMWDDPVCFAWIANLIVSARARESALSYQASKH